MDHSLSQHDQNYTAAVATACVYSYITTLKFCSEKKKATMWWSCSEVGGILKSVQRFKSFHWINCKCVKKKKPAEQKHKRLQGVFGFSSCQIFSVVKVALLLWIYFLSQRMFCARTQIMVRCVKSWSGQGRVASCQIPDDWFTRWREVWTPPGCKVTVTFKPTRISLIHPRLALIRV